MGPRPAESQTPKDAAYRCHIRPRGHAKRRQAQRGITDDDIRRAIYTGPLKRRRDIWQARASFVKVVFRMAPSNIFIITVFYRRP
ncbi:MAG TPA: DUF4258 domain-containing protein [Candidatus Thermoplasmatota archaeon]